jgi:hypothetical protein
MRIGFDSRSGHNEMPRGCEMDEVLREKVLALAVRLEQESEREAADLDNEVRGSSFPRYGREHLYRSAWVKEEVADELRALLDER